MSKVLVIAVSMFTGLSLFAATGTNGYGNVDLQLAMETVKDGVEAKKTLEKEYKAKQTTLGAMEESIKKLQQKLQKAPKAMSEEAKTKSAQEFDGKMMEYQKLLQQFQGDMQKRQVELTKPILDSMRSIIDEIGKSKGLDFVYEKNQSGIFYAKNAVDITNDVIKRYNEVHK
jgi:outer membrane protein